MNLNKITRAVNKIALAYQKNKPFIATAVSIGLGAAALGIGIKKAMDIPKITAEYEAKKEHFAARIDDERANDKNGVSKFECMLKADAGLKIVKTLALPVGLEIASALLNAYSTGEMWNRYKAATVVCGGLTATLTAFENRVRADVGDEKFRELRYGVKTDKHEWTEVDISTGAEVQHTDVVESRTEDAMPSIYAKWFEKRGDGYCTDWSPDPKFNRLFLQQKEKQLTQKLEAQGYLWLNDAYYELGLPLTEIGQRVGWIYDDKNPIGDNCVDFGIFSVRNGVSTGFIDRENNRYLLNFNVDGDLFGLPQLRKYGIEES